MKSEIKTCPFCRDKGAVSYDHANDLKFVPWIAVECLNKHCAAKGPRVLLIGQHAGDTERCAAQAIAVWNTRSVTAGEA